MDSVSTVSSASNAPAAGAASTAKTTATPRSAAFTAALEEARKELGSGEKLTAVGGHAYGRIEGGKRDDLCVNLSGNSRSGEAFRLVERDGRTFHVYDATEATKKLIINMTPKVATDAETDTDAASGTTSKTPASAKASTASFSPSTAA